MAHAPGGNPSGQLDYGHAGDARFPAPGGVRRTAPRSIRWPLTKNCGKRPPATSRAFWGQDGRRAALVRPFDKVLEWNEPDAKWFVGGKTNVSYNCLDAHLTTGRKNKTGPDLGRRAGRHAHAHLSAAAREVCKFANVLKTLGVERGDVVSIYMPMVPELAIAMLACAGSARSTR